MTPVKPRRRYHCRRGPPADRLRYDGPRVRAGRSPSTFSSLCRLCAKRACSRKFPCQTRRLIVAFMNQEVHVCCAESAFFIPFHPWFVPEPRRLVLMWRISASNQATAGRSDSSAIGQRYETLVVLHRKQSYTTRFTACRLHQARMNAACLNKQGWLLTCGDPAPTLCSMALELTEVAV